MTLHKEALNKPSLNPAHLKLRCLARLLAFVFDKRAKVQTDRVGLRDAGCAGILSADIALIRWALHCQFWILMKKITEIWRSQRLANLILLGISALLWSTESFSLPEDSRQNMDIYSDSYEFNFQNSTTTFIGNVVLNQGSLKINADRIVYYGKFEKGKSVSTGKIVATGNPARFQQTPELDTTPVVAVAKTLEYSVKNETLFLINDASLDQDGISLSGNRIEYDVKKALVKASSDIQSPKNKERVRLVIPPKTLQDGGS